MLDPVLLVAADRAHERLQQIDSEREQAQREFQQSVRRLHAAGATLREVGGHFGLSHQRVHQIVGNQTSPLTRGVGQLLRERVIDRLRDWSGFERLDGEVRALVAHAQDEARALGHSQVGTEHLLLALQRDTNGAAAQVLLRLGVDSERFRAGVVEAVGAGEPIRGEEPLPLTPRAKRVFERSLREALELNDNVVSTEHVLLAVVGETSGLAARLLRAFGANADRIRGEVTAARARR